MKQSKKNAFTLIELVAVLVIMAIIALIATPLVMSIIRKTRVSADKRSIDAYGRSIELAIAGYLMDTGSFPTSMEQLTIEYSGDEVVCSTTRLNPDSSVYLEGCTVGGRSVNGYTYGKYEPPTYATYEIGDEITYNGVNYYVIKDSDTTEDSVTLLKAEPITSVEISPYLTSTEVASKVKTSSTYVGMAYYSSEDCVSGGDVSGCSTDYTVSDVKQVVDVWKEHYASGASEARLITIDELIENFAYELHDDGSSRMYTKTVNTPSWIYAHNYEYWYWTMSQDGDDDSNVWVMWIYDGYLNSNNVGAKDFNVRPVIVLPKSAL